MERIKYLIQREWSNLKGLTPRERVYYVWDYYKMAIAILTLVLVLLIAGFAYTLGRGRVVLYVVLVNAAESDSSLFTTLLEEEGVNMDGCKVEVEDSYRLLLEEESITNASTVQVLAALFSMGDMDIFASDEAVFQRYAVQGGLEDLSLLLPAELLKAHETDLYYAQVNGAEVLCGIRMGENSPLQEAGWYCGDIVVGIASNAGNLGNAVTVIQALLERQE